ncbi:MAG: lamin tail domain-containing protein [Flavisolibacter sp.]
MFLLLFAIPANLYAQASRFDVVIDEIMADPTPVVGLPPAEFIEIKNTGNKAINLSGWKLITTTASSGLFPNYILQPDSFLILTSNANLALFANFGKTLSIPSFPSLDNDGTVLSLVSKDGKIIHSVAYQSSWHSNQLKKDGGWSLEMIDTKNPCTGKNNWRSSIDLTGGTPGRKNSVDAINIDDTPPQLIRTYGLDSLNIVAVFDETLDSSSASSVSNFSITNLQVVSAQASSPLFDRVVLKLASPLQHRTVYTLTASNIKDCHGNNIGGYNKALCGWSEDVVKNDIIINEILFNPKPDAFDYIEVYNNSKKIVDASRLFIANKNNVGVVGSIKKISESPFYIFPGDYFVITEDANSLQREYLVQHPENILVLPQLPSYPDDKGTVVLMNANGDIADEVSYLHTWHFALISDEEGVALEKIDPSANSQEANNWHSAASTAGYGTPTYKNSQLRADATVQAMIEVHPKVFSPDNDGQDDIATISYEVEAPGYLANISIFDAGGRLVRQFIKNDLMGLKGKWNWDGLDENKNKLPVGVYIIYTEIFNLQGKKKQFKHAIVLARRPR